MPSTNSRKPWTKCWRDISPSPTMSMPESSCHLIASNVASSFAAASSSPCCRHCGHNLFGSASQDGFGRLPAMDDGKIMRFGSHIVLVDANYKANHNVRAVFLRPWPALQSYVRALQGLSAHRCAPDD